MVTKEAIEASNTLLKTAIPPGLVAVFVGATNGVGETTVRQFAKYAAKPRVYLVGRSQEAGTRIVEECKALNPDGTFIFLKKGTHLMRNVDEVCNEIASKEEAINLLFLTVGTLQVNEPTEEGLNYPFALTVYARSRFIAKLLPLLRRAQGLRRVVSTFGATFEGQVHMNDFQGWHLWRMAKQGHEASIIDLDLEAHHKAAPEVSFVHNFPGAVESGIARGSIGWFMRSLKTIFALLGPLVHIPLEDAGDRHLYFGTSARYCAGLEDPAAGVPLTDGITTARGTDGKTGSGVYSISETGESSTPKIEALLARFRDEGLVEQVHQQIESDIKAALAGR